MEKLLRSGVKEAVKTIYGADADDDMLQVQKTRKEFEGDYTLVVFPLSKLSRRGPEQTAGEIGEYLVRTIDAVSGYNVIKGFLNLVIAPAEWDRRLSVMHAESDYGFTKPGPESETVVIEYSSPNTNKPLHLGHIRNNLLGYSLSRIFAAAGNIVIRTNIVNDRGIHICKSMLAWQKYSGGRTPESEGIKGDHFVGDYYVLFEKKLKEQAEELIAAGSEPETARDNAPLMQEARQMLVKWEAGDPGTVKLWQMMNSWVYEGFDVTYRALGVEFDRIYYESDTYKVGREIVLRSLEEGHLIRKEDGSVWIDLTDDKLDQKLLLRSDGTAVYMTQDLGTAVIRYNDYHFDHHIYVVGNEQNYHFQVLTLALKRMGYEWAEGLHHFSYGMVELPEGKMKSREGTVVDADDLVEEMTATATAMSQELGKLTGYSEDEKQNICRQIGLGALKYYILKVDPKKNMTFNPRESIDFNGNTGPFIQYTYARIRSVLKKAEETGIADASEVTGIVIPNPKEISVIKLLDDFHPLVIEAAREMSPALIANYCYELAREFNQFYHDFSILGEENKDIRNFRLRLSELTGRILEKGLWLLGIEAPERM
ncbi:MAG: arginine--tRNA ligase [Bacteroidales bacterium]|jgi:arginyl-tRNA synthetase|nr:arginine--tRNA ligase [Bacteroidales bacterium]